MSKKAELFHGGDFILGGSVDPMFSFSPEPICEAVGMRDGFTVLKTSVLSDFVSSTFFSEAALEEEKYWTLLNAMFKGVVHHMDERD